MRLGEYLKYCREYYGLNQIAMAASLGISQSYLCEIEVGKKNPKKIA